MNSMLQKNLVRKLVSAMPNGRLLTKAAELIGYDSDGLGYKHFDPDAVAIPADVEELRALVSVIRTFNVPYVVRGAGTSLSGGPVTPQGGIVIHTSRLRKILEVNKDDLYCVVECGVVLNRLNELLAEQGLYYPPDPSSGYTSTLGGNIACNAGGIHCFKYGVTGNYVLGLEVIHPDGTIHTYGGPAGGMGEYSMDWKQLLIGSEGTLGIILKAWLRVCPQPEKIWTFRATFKAMDSVVRCVQHLVSHPVYPAAMELLDPRGVDLVENSPMACGLPKGCWLLLTEIDGPESVVNAWVKDIVELIQSLRADDVAYSDNATERKALWHARKASGGLMGQISPNLVVQDAVIPKASLGELLAFVYKEADRAGVPVVNVFHAGDGNLHPNFMFDPEVPGQLEAIEEIAGGLMKLVADLGGTLSGEHGIGNDKSKYMHFVLSQQARAMQLSVAETFNPLHQMNPGKVFSERHYVA